MSRTRRWFGALAAAVVATTSVPGGAAQAQTVRAGPLDWTQEVPPPPVVMSPGTGFGVVSLDATQRFLTVNESYANLLQPVIDAHIHIAPPGVNGPVVINFPPNGFVLGLTAGSYSNVFDLLAPVTYGSAFLNTTHAGDVASARAAFVTAFIDGNTYLNIHTSARPAGEIRGQLNVVPEPSTYALVASGLGMVGMVGWRRRRMA